MTNTIALAPATFMVLRNGQLMAKAWTAADVPGQLGGLVDLMQQVADAYNAATGFDERQAAREATLTAGTVRWAVRLNLPETP